MWRQRVNTTTTHTPIRRVVVLMGARVNGVTLYSLKVIHIPDARGSWVLFKRYRYVPMHALTTV